MRFAAFRNARRSKGFTLIELAIVLVIIGLIVAGVLVGQDLIRAAEVRAAVGQYEKFNTAINTFRTKYNGMPGDLLAVQAASVEMPARTGVVGHGDGNGLLEGCSAGAMVAGCETLLVWTDLTRANVIDGIYSTATDALTAVTSAELSQYFPPAKLGNGNYWTVFSASGFNYYQLGGISSTDASGDYTLVYTITPIEAYNIDGKLDDGSPNTGVVRAKGQTAALNDVPTWADPATTQCITDGADATDPVAIYNRNITTGGTNLACHLTLRFN
jgi:prepilin-type N-terminal cleavage/methylation domain-containing protein